MIGEMLVWWAAEEIPASPGGLRYISGGVKDTYPGHFKRLILKFTS